MSSDALTTIDQANSGTRSSVIPGARRVRTVVATQTAAEHEGDGDQPERHEEQVAPRSTLPPPGPPLAM